MINELQILDVNKCCAGNYFFGYQQFYEFLTDKPLNRTRTIAYFLIERITNWHSLYSSEERNCGDLFD
jgi:hypothetical protein